jgi:hypothetical protein
MVAVRHPLDVLPSHHRGTSAPCLRLSISPVEYHDQGSFHWYAQLRPTKPNAECCAKTSEVCRTCTFDSSRVFTLTQSILLTPSFVVSTMASVSTRVGVNFLCLCQWARHLTQAADDLHAMLERSQAAGVRSMMITGGNLKESKEALSLANDHSEYRLSTSD